MGRRRLESHLYRRPDSRVWWCWFYDEHGRLQRRSTKCATREGAEAALAEFEKRARDPSYRASHSATLGRALEDLLAERRDVRKRAAGTLHMYRVKAGHLVRVLGGDRSLGSVGARDVDAYVTTRLAEGASRSTVGKELTTLRAALKLAKRYGSFPADVAEVMPTFAAEYKPRSRFLTPDELTALLAELEPDRAARVAFMVATAARWGESDRARRDDILATSVRLRGTKTAGSAREVPVLPDALAPMRRLLEHAEKHGAGSNGLMFTPWGNVRRDLAAACERASVPACSPNDLRRTMATWLRARGVAPQLIGAFLGHTDGRMVERVYGRLPPAELAAAMTGRRERTVRERRAKRGKVGAMGSLPKPKKPRN